MDTNWREKQPYRFALLIVLQYLGMAFAILVVVNMLTDYATRAPVQQCPLRAPDTSVPE